jgi:2-isopropylmalate synthase
VVPNLQLKLGIDCIPPECLAETARIAHAIAEIANIAPNTHQPYAGVSSFAHKAGLHASALKVDASLYNHIEPDRVGNIQRVLVTEMAGRASVEMKGRELGYDLSGDPVRVSRVVEQVKDLESQGWTFEAADASFELLLLRDSGLEQRFLVESWRTIVEQDETGRVRTEATVKVHANGARIISTAEGNGPVNALDRALRLAVIQFYPELEGLELTDYKVRILDAQPGQGSGTAAVTRVLVGTTDGSDEWSTVGVHENVIAASWRALEDALIYGLAKGQQSDT